MVLLIDVLACFGRIQTNPDASASIARLTEQKAREDTFIFTDAFRSYAELALLVAVTPLHYIV